MTLDARSTAVEALLRIEEQGGYSNIVLDKVLQGEGLSSDERALTARLVYGVVERRLTLDFLLNRLSTTPVIKMQSPIREILRLGVYQLLFMDGVPAFAAIHSAVEMTKRRGFTRLSGYVNGVLRRVQQDGEKELALLPRTDKGLELRYSCPRAWIRLWREAYGENAVNGLLSSINEAPPAYIRVNTVACKVNTFTDILAKYGVEHHLVEGLPAALHILNSAALKSLPSEWQKCYYFQDLASQWCCRALEAQPGERIADVCAAPGGKSFTVAQDMQNQGHVDAADLYEHKCAAMNRRATSLGLDIVTATVRDGAEVPAPARREQYDRVICDVPCSGLGVMRRKPEIRYKSPAEFVELPEKQLTILSAAAALVRPGGVLQYSTCTLRPQENEAVTAAFLAAHTEFSPRVLPLPQCFAQAGVAPSHHITLFPHVHNTDGFYIASFVKE